MNVPVFINADPQIIYNQLEFPETNGML